MNIVRKFNIGDLVLIINKEDLFYKRVGIFMEDRNTFAIININEEKIFFSKSSLLKINNKIKCFV